MNREELLSRIADGEEIKSVDFSGMDLSGLELDGVIFSNALLPGPTCPARR
jgi:uncharacterized protein YjbI with pentapeptide repeats